MKSIKDCPEGSIFWYQKNPKSWPVIVEVKERVEGSNTLVSVIDRHPDFDMPEIEGNADMVYERSLQFLKTKKEKLYKVNQNRGEVYENIHIKYLHKELES